MSKRTKRQSRSVIEELEELSEGYWLDAVSNLARWLTSAGCHEYALTLERDMRSFSLPSRPQVEAAVLESILGALSRIANEPPANLTLQQREELIGLNKNTIRLLQHYRLPRLRSMQKAEARAAKKLGPRQAAYRRENPDGGSEVLPLAPAPAASRDTPTDGTIVDSRIYLKGRPYRLTQGLRQLLNYLLTNPGVAEEAVIRQCGMSGASHLHKRLKDLRDALARELKGAAWELRIRAEETHLYFKWVPKNGTY